MRNGPKAIGLGVPAGEHGDHPRPRQRAADVDADDAGVRVRRADDEGMGLPGEVEVVGEPALAGDQPRVLAAADGLAEALRGLVGAGIEEGHVRTPGTVTIGTMPIKPGGSGGTGQEGGADRDGSSMNRATWSRPEIPSLRNTAVR